MIAMVAKLCDYDFEDYMVLKIGNIIMWQVNEVNGNVELKVQTIGLANILHGRVSYHS